MISAPQANRYAYTGDGSSTVFPYNSVFIGLDDLVVLSVVIATNVATKLVRGTDYTVSGGLTNGLAAVGSVTMLVAPTSAVKLVIYGAPAIDQPVHVVSGGALPPATMETAWDLCTLLAQRLNDVLSRGMTLPDGDTSGFNPTLPAPMNAGDMISVNAAGTGFGGFPTIAQRASRFLAFDPSGMPIAALPITTATPASAVGLVLLQALTKAIAFDSISPLTTQGDLLYFNATTNTRLPAGTVGQVLSTNGAGANPSWITSPSSRNMLLNSGFDFWQRGTTVTVANTVSTYLADRWYVKNSSGTNGVITFSQVTGVTNGSKFGAKVQITTAPTAAQANGCELYQTLENFDSLELLGATASLSALIKSFGNVNQVGLQFFYKTTEAKVDTAIGSEVLVTVNTSTFSLGQILAQALGTAQTASGVVGVRIRITGVSSGNVYDINNGFVVEQVQMNTGPLPAAWTRSRFAATELDALRRFYEKSYDLTVNPAAATSNGCRIFLLAAAGSGSYVDSVAYKQMKRVNNGTITVYSTVSGTGAKARDVTTSADITVAAGQSGMTGFGIATSAGSDGDQLNYHWAVDAEI